MLTASPFLAPDIPLRLMIEGLGPMLQECAHAHAHARACTHTHIHTYTHTHIHTHEYTHTTHTHTHSYCSIELTQSLLPNTQRYICIGYQNMKEHFHMYRDCPKVLGLCETQKSMCYKSGDPGPLHAEHVTQQAAS